jgi:hypothetical protein
MQPPPPCPAAPLPLQSANAWSQFSKWRPRVGVFVNLESLGPGGVPIVFQHAGAWVIEAYARAAGFPRGSIAGQVRGEVVVVVLLLRAHALICTCIIVQNYLL